MKGQRQNAVHERDKKSGLLTYEIQGVITVEMSYILPLIFSVLVLIIHTVFYFHDKNIMIGAAAETAVTGAQMKRRPDREGLEDLNDFYRQRIAGKLILFPETSANTEISDKQITVVVTAGNGRMKLEIKQTAPILKPEEKIRKKRILEEMAGKITGSKGETG